MNNTSDAKLIINSIKKYIHEDVTIWMGLLNERDAIEYIKHGFDNPMYVNESPLKFKFKNHGISLMYKMGDVNKDRKSERNKLSYVISNSKLPISAHNNLITRFHSTKTSLGSPKACSITSRLTKSAVNELRKLNEASEKELAGSLGISKVVKRSGISVFELSLNRDSIKKGMEEEVKAVYGRYNFHTHPEKAYKNNNVTNGWPSSTDYVAFVKLNDSTIFHVVVTLEGIYVISFSSEWCNNPDKINIKFVGKNYDIDHNMDITPEQYVNIVNSRKYKGKQLFNVDYLRWEDADNIFVSYYKKSKSRNCIFNDDQLRMYR